LRQGNKSFLVRSRYKICELRVKAYATRSQQGATSTSFCENEENCIVGEKGQISRNSE